MKPLFAALLLALWPLGLSAQDRQSHCIAIADADPNLRYLQLASYRAPLPDYAVRINYVAHATFLLETSEGVQVATDYAGFLGHRDVVPDVVTMNIAHETHNTAAPDPRIRYVLQGWNPAGGPALHHLELGDLLIRNVPTNIRNEYGGVMQDGNSIFVFEVGGLCIGHLGHLHHEPDDLTYAALGRLDVVMAPVDGGMTLELPVMLRVLKRLKSSIVIPMHWFGDYTLDAFVRGMADQFDILQTNASFIEVSLRSLPKKPTVMLLTPRWLSPALK